MKFSDLPEALENNFNLPLRCSFRPVTSKPILPNISSEKGINAEELLINESNNGLIQKFIKVFKKNKNVLNKDSEFINEEIIFKGKIGRIRDIKIHKETGELYMLSDKGELWRMHK